MEVFNNNKIILIMSNSLIQRWIQSFVLFKALNKKFVTVCYLSKY